MSHEILSGVPWPYPDNQFPEGVGVIIQRTVLEGREPARSVVHDTDGCWLASDGVNNPNLPGASALVCMHHLAETDPSVAELATMPPGTMAWREDRDDPWTLEPHEYPAGDDA